MLPLEGVGGQLYAPAAALGEECVPINRDTADVQFRQRLENCVILRQVLLEHGHEEGVGAGDTVLCHGGQYAARSHLHKRRDTRVLQPGNLIRKPHRIPHMPHPKLRITHPLTSHHPQPRPRKLHRPHHPTKLLQHRIHQR
ncbi:hypothetical protein ACH4UR_35520, partial [Streptomyces lydicus]|uniref:hypothetical protein n=1 Tax=Streptomyces lydicus TaxID=47763 RepID=UPI003789A582